MLRYELFLGFFKNLLFRLIFPRFFGINEWYSNLNKLITIKIMINNIFS